MIITDFHGSAKPLSGAAVAQGHALKRGKDAHAVQFYEQEDALGARLAEFAGAALGAGRSCLVVATSAHRRSLSRRLTGWGLDVNGMVDSGRFILLDAAETLSLFMVNDQPDGERFAASLGCLMSQISRTSLERSKRPAVFGEMVALLCAEGKPEAAIRLEELWNDLGEKHRFSLLCAYPLRLFGRKEDEEAFLHVCAAHSHVGSCEAEGNAEDESGRMLAANDLRQRAQLLDRSSTDAA